MTTGSTVSLTQAWTELNWQNRWSFTKPASMTMRHPSLYALRNSANWPANTTLANPTGNISLHQMANCTGRMIFQGSVSADASGVYGVGSNGTANVVNWAVAGTEFTTSPISVYEIANGPGNSGCFAYIIDGMAWQSNISLWMYSVDWQTSYAAITLSWSSQGSPGEQNYTSANTLFTAGHVGNTYNFLITK